jgi:hypothetical protein
MVLLAFTPETDIEHRVLAGQRGEVTGDALLHEIAAANLYVPSRDAVQADGSRFQPVLIDVEGQPYISVYTAPGRPPNGETPYLLQALGCHFFLRLPAGYGVIVNPGYETQMLIPAHGVATFQQDLRKA